MLLNVGEGRVKELLLVMAWIISVLWQLRESLRMANCGGGDVGGGGGASGGGGGGYIHIYTYIYTYIHIFSCI